MTRSSATVASGPGKKGKAGLLQGRGLNYCSLLKIICLGVWCVLAFLKCCLKCKRHSVGIAMKVLFIDSIHPHHQSQSSNLNYDVF